MKKYIILLRGINVSGKNKLPMADLRELLNDLRFQNVQTYIQSGNIILTSELSKSITRKRIKNGILAKFGYDIPVIIRTVFEFEKAIINNPFKESTEKKKMFFTFLNRVPKDVNIEINTSVSDAYKIVNDVVYLFCETGYGNTKLSNNLFEKKLKVIATTRNYNTTLKMLALATT